MSSISSVAASVADSVHIKHYDIRIDSLNFSQQKIWGVTTLTFESKVDGLSELHLLLDGFIVDSIGHSSGILVHSYDNLNLQIDLPTTLNTGGTETILVAYHGSPAQDPSGWGGYYWSGTNYAFNLGVGFEEDPHVYGRAWFPCVDVFTDRATYSFHIRTSNDYKAFCNGELVNIENHGSGIHTYHWELYQTIPTYLASMAVADYHFMEREYGGIETIWAAWAIDTMNVLNTFQNIDEAVNAFTSSYGPYRWDKIGYALVPFNAGAMEHASSIHIGRPFVDGSLNYETLWAHELAHMWWGDLVTCEDQENMWLNEGFAAYSEALFTEEVYGDEAYKDWIRENHRKVLQFAHVTDGQYFAMNEIPHSVTYGSTVYEKGPEVIHTLRNYMGDNLFFEACRDYMDSLAFGNANSHDLRDIFSISSGLDLNPFFDGWIFEAGFPHFQIDSFFVQDNGLGFDVTIHLRQKQRGNSHIYEMDLPINLTDGTQNMDMILTVDEEHESFTVSCPFNPKMITLDRWERMSDAIADYEMTVSNLGTFQFDHTNAAISVLETGTASSIVRIEDHFVQPDGFIGTNPGIFLNPYHYWSVDGIFTDGFMASVEFDYNGSTSTSQGHMDNELIITEDSLVFMYRIGVGHEWQEVNGYEVITGASLTNKRGSVQIDTLKKGEYVLARRDITAGVNEFDNLSDAPFAFPNPSNGTINLNLPEGIWEIEIFSLDGRLVKRFDSVRQRSLDLELVQMGAYLMVATQNKTLLSQKILIE